MSQKNKKDTVSNFQISEEYREAVKELSKGGLVVLKEIVVEQTPNQPYNSSVRLMLCIDAHAVYSGQVTKRHYEWARAGSVEAVDSLDAPYLLEKRIKSQSCCNTNDSAVFQVVD